MFRVLRKRGMLSKNVCKQLRKTVKQENCVLCFEEGVALLEACPCPFVVAACRSVTLLTKNRSIGASDQLTRR